MWRQVSRQKNTASRQPEHLTQLAQGEQNLLLRHAQLWASDGIPQANLGDIMAERMRQQFSDHQIPSAEQEADRLSASAAGAQTAEQVKAQMGEALGADFSSVRFHTGPDAVSMANQMGARAYTTGRDVYFGEGGFQPSIAAHELVHTAQQGSIASSMATVSAPAGQVQMWPWGKKKASHHDPQRVQINAGSMKFGKRAYRSDQEYRSLEGLIGRYNETNSAEDKAALLEATMQYIDSNSAGKEAKHKGRTRAAENLLYQLTVSQDTSDKARGTLERFRASGLRSTEGDEIGTNTLNQGLDEMTSLVNGSGQPVPGGTNHAPYSKALQMAATGVLSSISDRDTFAVNGRSGTSKRIEDDHITINSRANGVQDFLGTGLHEMTHAASGNIYGNSSIFFTIGQDATTQEIRARRDDRNARLMKISQTAHEQALETNDYTLDDYINSASGRVNYASSAKVTGQYLPGQEIGMLRKAVEHTSGDSEKKQNAQSVIDQFGSVKNDVIHGAYQDFFSSGEQVDGYEGLTETEQTNMQSNRVGFEQFRRAMADLRGSDGKLDESKFLSPLKGKKDSFAKRMGGGPTLCGETTLNEYDPVINQALIDYEYSHDDRESEYYRTLKAAVLRSHVDRELEKLRKGR